MANVQSKMINGVEFKAPTSIRKLSDIEQGVPHTVVSLNNEPTRYKSFIVTISNEDTLEEYKLYMPGYIAKRGT